MAMRKFRKYMKPVIWVVTVLFVLSSVIFTFLGVKSSYSNKGNNTAFVLNKTKVSKLEVVKLNYLLSQEYQRYLGEKFDKDLVEILALDQVVEKNIILELADKLNITATSKEIDEQYRKIEKSIGSRDEFIKVLAMQGLTRKGLKEEIKKEIIIRKTFDKIEENTVVEDAEIEKYYSLNKVNYSNKALEEVKSEIEDIIKKDKGQEKILQLIETTKKENKISDVSPEYQNYLEKVVINEDGIEITNIDIAKKTLQYLISGEKTKVDAEKKAQEYYQKQLKVVKDAMAKGIKLEENYPADYEIKKYKELLADKLKEEIVVSDDELSSYFEKNQKKYDTEHTAEAKIAIVKIEPSEEDKKVAKEKAEEILKDLTVENFAEKAREFSDDPNGKEGGDLGWFTRGMMVSSFEEAAFAGEAGKIYPKVVITEYGYHLIYVEDKNDAEGKVKASHILISAKISEATKEKKLKELESLKEKINSKALTYEELEKNRDDIVENNLFIINENGYISRSYYNKNLTDIILKADLYQTNIYVEGNEVFLYKKIKETPYKKAQFDEVKELVKEDILNEKVNKIMSQYN